MNVEPIQKFLARVHSASQGRAKDVRLSVEEAQLLAASIGELLAATVAISTPKEATTVVKVDGGGFRK